MQKGFAPIYILIGILILGIIGGGAYYFGKSQVARSQPTQPTITPSPIPDETVNWKTYTNLQYGYSVKYPSSLNQSEISGNDTYLSMITFNGSVNNSDWFSIAVRDSNLQDEIKYQKSRIEGHVLVKLTKEKEIMVGGFSGVLLEYTPDEPDNGSTTSFVIFNNGKYSYTISGAPQTLDQILSTFKFLPATAGKDQKQESTEDQFCGGFAGKLCPEGFTCKLEGDYPDAGGKCVKG